jgi:hypothetical protein
VLSKVWERDGGLCALCGAQCTGERGEGWSLHHRLRRGAGSTRREYVNLPGNLVLLCGHGSAGCHHQVETERAWATGVGLLVRDGVVLPTEVPLIHAAFGSRWVRLHDNGDYEIVGDAT